ncbi:MAG: hypothetical protein GY862_18230 [Gammaproteobacteria bacterium]|nr:hypothetical protein [Gammaproteobacteria bacterium]
MNENEGVLSLKAQIVPKLITIMEISMKKVVGLMISFLFLIPVIAQAGDSVIRVCGGPNGLSYDTYVRSKLPKISGISYEFINTEGGGENIDQLSKGSCDLGIIAEPMIPKSTESVVAIAPVFYSYGQLVCHKERTDGAKQLSDLLDMSRKAVIAIGGRRSTTAYTFKKLGELDSTYAVSDDPRKSAFIVTYVGMSKAIGSVIAGKLDCAFTASGLSFKFAKAIDFSTSGKVLRMLDMDDSDFNDDDTFEFYEIDDDRFPNLLYWDVDTIRFKTYLAASASFISRFSMAYGEIAGAIPPMAKD